MTISKFGGSATASRLAIENIKALTKDQNRRILVFSAVGKESKNDTKATDLLINYSIENNSAKALIEKTLIDKFERLKISLNINFDVKAEWNEIFKKYKKSQNKNFLISRGEFVTSKMVSQALKTKFVPAEEIFYFKDNQIDFQRIKLSAENYLKSYRQIIVPGFYGVDEKGEIVLLSRGGSDVSAAVFAKVLNAEVYENWTDVNGIYQKDPHIQKSEQIKRMDYSQLLSLAENGARVIHKDCVKLLKGTEVSLIVGSIQNPKEKSTIISDKSNEKRIEEERSF